MFARHEKFDKFCLFFLSVIFSPRTWQKKRNEKEEQYRFFGFLFHSVIRMTILIRLPEKTTRKKRETSKKTQKFIPVNQPKFFWSLFGLGYRSSTLSLYIKISRSSTIEVKPLCVSSKVCFNFNFIFLFFFLQEVNLIIIEMNKLEWSD